MTAVDKKVTDLTEITPVVTDVTYVVDVSDTTDDPAGTSKKTTFQKILDLLQPLILTAAGLLKWNADKIQDIDVDDTAPTDNQVLTYDDASSKWKPAPAGTASPLTTKGDLYGYDTTNQRIPIGTDGQVLTADSTDDQGVAWKAIGSESKVTSEIPTGDIDGSNKDFVLANTPFTGTLKVYLNGVRQKVTDDYTLATATISFVTAPTSDSKILCDYDLNVAASGNADTLDGQHAPTGTIVGTSDTQTLTNKDLTSPTNLISFNSPRGFLINGKIVPSVASNNLTVAIKGLDGNDPSATNPVYCRIGDTVRSITSALSVTKNAGTNWFGSGKVELATKEIDYFVYLGYNATDGVVVGFSKVPFATIYGDFSTTTTNDFYCAISNISNAAAGDIYENIGRFGATLSAGAGYTWSVPTFTGANLIQRPIYETRFLDWVPVKTTRYGDAWTNVPTTNYAKYQIKDKVVHVVMQHTMHATPGGSVRAQYSLPIAGNFAVIAGQGGYNDTDYTMRSVIIVGSEPSLVDNKYDGTFGCSALHVHLHNCFYPIK